MPADDGAIDYRINDDRSYSRTGPDGMTNHHNKADKIVLGNSPIMQSTGKAPTAHWTCTDETAASPYAAMSTRKMLFSQNNTTNKPTKKVPLYVGVQPGQVWMDKRPHVGRDPDTDGHFHPTPTWGDLEAVAHHQWYHWKTLFQQRPPLPFLQLRSSLSLLNSQLGQVTVEIDWELKAENSKLWNPEIQFTNN